jgi:hypothetical protein
MLGDGRIFIEKPENITNSNYYYSVYTGSSASRTVANNIYEAFKYYSDYNGKTKTNIPVLDEAAAASLLAQQLRTKLI